MVLYFLTLIWLREEVIHACLRRHPDWKPLLNIFLAASNSVEAAALQPQRDDSVSEDTHFSISIIFNHIFYFTLIFHRVFNTPVFGTSVSYLLAGE